MKDKFIDDYIMEEYVNESIEVCGKKTFGESYDKEWALKDEWQRVGLQQGIVKGIEQGSKKASIEIAKEMIKENIPINQVLRITKLSIEEIEKLK